MIFYIISDILCVDVLCFVDQVTLTKDNFTEAAQVLMPYVMGDSPHQGGLAWHKARSIYAIANIGNIHWVAMEISMEDQIILVYNSISSSINWKNIPELFLNASKFVP